MLQYRQKHRCTVHCHKQAIIVHTHIHKYCFPVVALGKLKLHYGPPEGMGEGRIEKEEKRERLASVLFSSALDIKNVLV